MVGPGAVKYCVRTASSSSRNCRDRRVVVLADEEDVVLDHVGHRRAGLGEGALQALEGVARLGRHVGADRTPVRVERHLAADEDDVVGAHRLGPAVPDDRLKPWIDH